jgi:hypothetical protein
MNKKSNDRPPDALTICDGLFYKIGLHNRAYYWDGYEWRVSSKSHSEIFIHTSYLDNEDPDVQEAPYSS